LARVLDCAEVSAETKARLRAQRAGMNAFAVRQEVETAVAGDRRTANSPAAASDWGSVS